MAKPVHPTYKNEAGEKVPSVTTIIGNQLGWNKRILIAWARRTAMQGDDPNEVLAEAADIGTLAHALCECRITGKDMSLEDYTAEQIEKATLAFSAFVEWEKKYHLEYIESEKQVVSEEYGYGGTIDLIAKHDDDFWLVDFKTSKGVYSDHIIQVAAYRNVARELGIPIKECHVLKLSKVDGSFEHHHLDDQKVDAGWEVFKHCIELWKLQQILEPPKKRKRKRTK